MDTFRPRLYRTTVKVFPPQGFYNFGARVCTEHVLYETYSSLLWRRHSSADHNRGFLYTRAWDSNLSHMSLRHMTACAHWRGSTGGERAAGQRIPLNPQPTLMWDGTAVKSRYNFWCFLCCAERHSKNSTDRKRDDGSFSSSYISVFLSFLNKHRVSHRWRRPRSSPKFEDWWEKMGGN